MAKQFVLALGIVLAVIGVLGFIPALTPDEQLLGVFAVSAGHSVVLLLAGLVGIVASLAGKGHARSYAQVFGVVFGIIAILGFLGGSTEILGFITVNPADNYLHLAIALASLYVGFAPETRRSRA